jgi:hypothetical protein
MEVTFNCISANVAFMKAKRRHGDLVDSLLRTAVFVSTEDLPFDTLQVIMLDRDSTYARRVGCKKDRICQFEVSIPAQAEVDYSQPSAFVQCLAGRLKVAIEGCGIPAQPTQHILESIESFEKSLT